MARLGTEEKRTRKKAKAQVENVHPNDVSIAVPAARPKKKGETEAQASRRSKEQPTTNVQGQRSKHGDAKGKKLKRARSADARA